MSTERQSGSKKRLALTDEERAEEQKRLRRRQKEKEREKKRAENPPRDWWLPVFDLCLFAALLVPFVLGGRLAYGELLLVVATIGCSISWVGYQFSQPAATCVWTKVEWLLLAVLSVGLLQITPLPAGLLDQLSPNIKTVLPLWNGAPESLVGTWSYLSLTVSDTRSALAIGIAYVLLFWLTAQRVREVADVSRIMKVMCVLAGIMAGFGLIQYFGSNGLYYWVFEYPAVTTADQIKGGFTNKNHFAAFLMLSIGPCIWWLMELMDGRQADEPVFGTAGAASLPRPVRVALVGGMGALVIVAWLSSLSRGAVVAGAIGVGVMLLIMALRSMISIRVVGGLCLIGLVGGALQFAVGYEAMMNRLDRWDDNGRQQIWQANLAAESEFRFFGSGIGSHRYIYHRYLDKPYDEHEYSHAESNFLNVATETGVVGLSLALVALSCCFWWCYQGLRVSQSKSTTIALLALMVSVIATSIHALVDFTWYVPGYMVFLLVQMACLCRLTQLLRATAPNASPVAPWTMPHWTLAPAGLVLLVAGLWMLKLELPLYAAEPHWLNYRRMVFNPDAAFEADAESDGGLSEEKKEERSRELAARKIRVLRSAIKANPHDSRFHVRLARLYVALFHDLQESADNQMPLNQIRDAAISSGFESRQQLDEWLDRAIGNHVKFARAASAHSLKALRLNPLQFYGYVDFSELAFLQHLDPNFEGLCLKQALAIAPYEGYALFIAGREAWMRQDSQSAFDYWKRAFHRNYIARRDILRIMVSSGLGLDDPTTTQTDALVRMFEPELDGLEEMARFQSENGLVDDEQRTLRLLAGRLVEKAQASGNFDRLKDWLRATGVYDRMNQPEQVELCFHEAIKANQSSFLAHYEFGIWLYTQHRGSDAMDQLRWCQRVQPNDRKIAKLMDRIQRGQFPNQIQQAKGVSSAGAQ